jgi:streptogramin lyase
LNQPWGVAVDFAGNLFIADYGNNRIRKVSNGVIATAIYWDYPQGVAVDAAGNLFIADNYGRISKLSNGVITTVAGTGMQGFSGDNGPATGAQLSGPAGVAVDAAGNVYVADFGNNRIRVLVPFQFIAAVTNAASNLPGSISPGEIVVL